MSKVIGICCATRNIVAGVFDTATGLLGKSLIKIEALQAEDGSTEYDPEDFRTTAFAAIREALAKSGVNPAEIKAISAGGHNSELIFLNKNGKTFCRTKLGRGQKYPEEDKKLGSLKELKEWTGNKPMKENLASKILWYKKHDPDTLAKIDKILYEKDWINYCLTGNAAMDVSAASYSQLLDIHSRNWKKEIFDWLGVPETIVGPVYESREIIGYLTAEAAKETGLPEGVAVNAGLTTKAAIELSSLCVKNGEDIYTFNMSGNIVTHSKTPYVGTEQRIKNLCSAVKGEYMLLTDTASAFSALKWYGNMYYQDIYNGGREPEDFRPLEELAALSEAGARGVTFLPYIKGEMVPYKDPGATGVLFGMTEKTGREDILRAVMEGICFSTLDCIRFMHGATELPENGIYMRALGCPDWWLQMLADMSGKSVWYMEPKDGTITGAAVLAAVTAGDYTGEAEACKAMIMPTAREYRPQQENREAYEKAYRVYQNLYPALQDVYHLQ